MSAYGRKRTFRQSPKRAYSWEGVTDHLVFHQVVGETEAAEKLILIIIISFLSTTATTKDANGTGKCIWH